MGYVELLLSERDEPFDDDTLSLIRHISKASERLSEIVRDMVDVSLIDGRTIDLISQDVDINILVQRAVDKWEPSVHQRHQALKLELTRDLPLVKCDVERIIQVIGNVLGNAIKFSPDKGRIIVQTKLVYRPRSPEKLTATRMEKACSLSEEQMPYMRLLSAIKVSVSPRRSRRQSSTSSTRWVMSKSILPARWPLKVVVPDLV